MSAAIESYGLIGDCQTAALVGRDGSIDWLCWPRFDSDACFAALVGRPSNGRWLITPSDDAIEVSRRYRRETLVLETTFRTGTGKVTVIDFMQPRGRSSDLIRLVRGDEGEVPMCMELVLRFGYGATMPWVSRLDDGARLAERQHAASERGSPSPGFTPSNWAAAAWAGGARPWLPGAGPRSDP